MFSESRNNRHRQLPIATGIGDTEAEIADNALRIGKNATKVPMLNLDLNGDWSNSVRIIL